MGDDIGISGRNKEIKEIHEFILSRVGLRKSGILYLTGPPGTGKSMSIQLVLDRIKTIPKLNINCLRAQSSKVILSKICRSVGLKQFVNYNESEMIARLSKKFTGRTCETYLIVLDEMDQLPKSKNVDLIRTLFSWPNQPNSKLILIGIANTVNLTSRYQIISSIIGKDHHHITKILFKPYTTKEIKSILHWYLENDENFEDASLDSKALDMIAAKFARENGDIRSALNALKSAIDDTVKQQSKPPEQTQFPTPPTTPPSTPCKDKTTNLASVANSIRKRQRNTHYTDDVFPFPHQIILTCIYKLCSGVQNGMVDSQACEALVIVMLDKYNLPSTRDDYRAMLDNLELQGWIAFKKGRPRERIILKVSSNQLSNLVQRKDMILDLINSIV